jgi:hypothetical protein
MHATKDVLDSSQRFEEATLFVERALIDFALLDEFESRPAADRQALLQWIAAARDEEAEEDRVSRLLDALDAGTPLGRLYERASLV